MPVIEDKTTDDILAENERLRTALAKIVSMPTGTTRRPFYHDRVRATATKALGGLLVAVEQTYGPQPVEVSTLVKHTQELEKEVDRYSAIATEYTDEVVRLQALLNDNGIPF